MRRVFTILTILTFILPAFAQNKRMSDEFIVMDVDVITDEQLDTINLNKKFVINDYSMIGFQYGVGLSRVMWTPSQKQEMLFTPINTGVTFTTYGKMFGYMPFFGLQAGVFYGKEGYKFEYDIEDEDINSVQGAQEAVMEVVEVPLLAHMHFDSGLIKIIANIGCYGGYRLSIARKKAEHRTPTKYPQDYWQDEYQYKFKSSERRWDYGIKGSVGIGLMYDPIEIHLTASYKHSLSSLYEPDFRDKDYYRFAYPSNIVIALGVHYQLTKRIGKTKSEIKRMARESVYNRNHLNGNN